jgi:hypothetical protein
VQSVRVLICHIAEEELKRESIQHWDGVRRGPISPPIDEDKLPKPPAAFHGLLTITEPDIDSDNDAAAPVGKSELADLPNVPSEEKGKKKKGKKASLTLEQRAAKEQERKEKNRLRSKAYRAEKKAEQQAARGKSTPATDDSPRAAPDGASSTYDSPGVDSPAPLGAPAAGGSPSASNTATDGDATKSKKVRSPLEAFSRCR